MRIRGIQITSGLVFGAITHPLVASGVLTEMRKVKRCLGSLKPELARLVASEELPSLSLEKIDQISRELATRVGGEKFHRLVLLYLLCLRSEPISIVETGVENGYSSSFFLQAINDGGGGRLHSIDLPRAEYVRYDGKVQKSYISTNMPTGWVIPSELKMNWELAIGNSRTELPKLLNRLGSIDVFCHDDEHTYEVMMSQYRLAWPHLRSGGLLLSDDVNWNQAFADFCKEKVGQSEFIVGSGGRVGVLRRL